MSECSGNCSTCPTNSTQNLLSIGVRKNFDQYPPDFCYPTNAVLNLTDDCTHRCKMCFVDFHPRRMSLETAQAAVEFVIRNSKALETYGGGENPSIIFFGGEPLLEYDSIIVPLIEEYGDRVHWSITTNGLLLDEDKVDYFRKHQVNILFSFDGDQKTQDMQRPLKTGQGSFESNVKNIPYYVLRYPFGEMRATVTKESIPYLYDNFLFAEKMGFGSVDFVMDSRVEISYSEEDEKNLQQQMDRIAIHILSKLILSNDSVIQFNNLISAFTRLESNEYHPGFNNDVWRCGLGTTSVGVGCDGKIYPCQEQSSTLSDDIGDVFTGIDKDKHWAHIQSYMEAIDFIGKNHEQSNWNLFLLNEICPNRFLQGAGIGEGPEMMSRVLYNTVTKLYWSNSKSPNPRVNKYFYKGGRRD